MNDPISTVSEFSRRAMAAFRGVSLQHEHLQPYLLVKQPLDRGGALDEPRQQMLYMLVLRYRRQITDEALMTYAQHHIHPRHVTSAMLNNED